VTEGILEVEDVFDVFEVGALLGLLSLLVFCTLFFLVGGFALLETLLFGSNHVCILSVAKSGTDQKII
jgi:hypothetical protein